MSGGLVGLFDDIASLAKLAAASVDDVGAAAGRASAKAAGVVVDDAAVTPAYVRGLAAKRELPIIKRIAVGSIRNKILFILPAALILSEFVPILVEIILMCGGCYLAYEGAEKVHHKLAHRGSKHGADEADKVDDRPAVERGPEAEDATVSAAVRTDFILSAEIMVIALKEVIDEGFFARAVIMVVVAFVITVVVYGAVALLVKMDDIGLHYAQSDRASVRRFGMRLVTAMPKVLKALSTIGTAAMLWVGGHILLVGSDELGWHWPYEQVHNLEHHVEDIAGIGGVLAWLINTAISAVIGLIVGLLLLSIIGRFRRDDHDGAAAH